jgi:hypothetical protein
MELAGTLNAEPAKSFRLELDGKDQPAPPTSHATLSAKGIPVQLALVVQASEPYAAALPQVRNGARALLRALPPGSVVTLIAYDSQVRPLASGVTAAQALEAVAELKAGSVERELPALVAALEMGIRRLSLKPTPARRVMVVVSDGLNISMRRQLFRALGTGAQQAGIPIFPVGFSPADERGPLLNLGELAKRSVGMFRWAKTADELEGQLKNVAVGITEQLLLTFPVDDGCAKPHTIRVVLGGARSTGARVEAKEPITGWPAARLKLRKELGPSWATVAAVLGGALLLLIIGVPAAIFMAVRRARGSVPASPSSSPTSQAASEPQPTADEARFLLVQEGGAHDGVWKEVLPGDNRIGAASDCLRLRLSERQGVAAHHVTLNLSDGVLSVWDMGPGLLVNDQPTRLANLKDGDLLRLGKARLRVRRV